jgi:alkylation response protein AidB-like acyl-CoA dehydrogenase
VDVPGVRHGLNPRPPDRGARQSKEYEIEIERLYRDAPMLLIGEGTAEIQKMIIGRRLLERFR